eukprot:gene9340-17043_t
MEGKHLAPSNLREGAKDCDLSTEHIKSYGLVRKNIHEAWKLEQNFQHLEEAKLKLKTSIDRMERQLVIEREKTRKCSGSFNNNEELIRTGLPQVILSRTTTQRSRLPWQQMCKVTKKSEERSNSRPPKTPAKREGQVISLPRLQKAMEDSKKTINEATLCCRRIPKDKNIIRRINSVYTPKGHNVSGGKERSQTNDFLTVPKYSDKKIPKELFGTWMREASDCETGTKDELQIPPKDYTRRSVSVTW